MTKGEFIKEVISSVSYPNVPVEKLVRDWLEHGEGVALKLGNKWVPIPMDWLTVESGFDPKYNKKFYIHYINGTIIEKKDFIRLVHFTNGYDLRGRSSSFAPCWSSEDSLVEEIMEHRIDTYKQKLIKELEKKVQNKEEQDD